MGCLTAVIIFLILLKVKFKITLITVLLCLLVAVGMYFLKILVVDDMDYKKRKDGMLKKIGFKPKFVHIEEGSSTAFEREVKLVLNEVQRQADIFDFKYDYSISYSNTNDPFYEWYSAVITFKYYE